MPSPEPGPSGPPAATAPAGALPSPDAVPAGIALREGDGIWRTLRRTAPWVWPAGQPRMRALVGLSLTALVLSRLVTVATPLIYKAAVDLLSGEGAGDLGWTLGAGAVALTVIYGLSRVLATGLTQLRDALFAPVGQMAQRRIALEIFTHLHRLSLRFHIARKTGALSRVLERGVKSVDFLLRYLVFSIGPLILELALVAAVLWWMFDLRYLGVIALTIVLYTWFTFWLTERRVALRREMNTQDADANQKAIDSLLNFETVKYFAAEAHEARRYDGAMARYCRAAVRTNVSLAALNFGQAAILAVGTVAVMVMAALGVQAGTLTVGDFVMVNAYLLQLAQPLNMLGTVYREIRQALTDMAGLFDLLDQPAEVADRPGAPPLRVTGGHIRFEQVAFGYDPERRILHGVTLDVPPGQTLAVVGASGSGKSTLGRLLFRFYDVGAGRITIDGQDLREVSQASLHAAIGVVPQDTVLFNDTIGYNIAYGHPAATREEIVAAARAARIHDFIASLPHGYATLVGERGLKLSGGEKQRVGIARTLLKNPPILVLDEATSALDTQTERDIQAELRAMGRGRTVIAIAHRLSTIADADHIVVLEGGRIVEEGRHEALLAREGRYAQLWARQRAEEVGEGEDRNRSLAAE